MPVFAFSSTVLLVCVRTGNTVGYTYLLEKGI
jgi:hypothetical protein